ncbi:MAG: hypothetical protein IT441_10810 [Phycisphaeraceae bacterium]|nr:hypothetical protein [Phycisphaeraceae bacterium]
MVLSPIPRRGLETLEGLGDAPPRTFWTCWFGGLIAPALFAMAGVASILYRKSYLPGRYGGMELHGLTAIFMGVACLGLAVLLHFHYFWLNRLFHVGIAELGKLLGLIALLAGMVGVIVRVAFY